LEPAALPRSHSGVLRRPPGSHSPDYFSHALDPAASPGAADSDLPGEEAQAGLTAKTIH
jgi:hypothetical protein